MMAMDELMQAMNTAAIAHWRASPAEAHVDLGLSPFLATHPDSALADLARRCLSGDVVWLGMPPASKASILAAEARLGISLPPSYKQFLSVSNGFLMPGNYISTLLPVELIQPFGNENATIASDWRSMLEEEASEDEPWLMARLGDAIQLSGPPGKGEDFVLLDPTFMHPGEENEIATYWTQLQEHHSSFVAYLESALAGLLNLTAFLQKGTDR
ncbi:SMI1/KNR4 family protein [Stenotrophomonas maltophilia]|uniref:SMI1/KNR4 family protein n=2 Tax=Stenotrophomonas maltophilia TaxID=40324 RepID=A0A4S2CXX3_STEMA|nr:SMI1/KNR4 family protein [Stenotrophomonas maltophilia]